MHPDQKASLLAYARRLTEQSSQATEAGTFESMDGGRLAVLGGEESLFDDRSQQILSDIAAGRDLDDESAAHLEAIILPGLRPVVNIKADSYARMRGEWSPLNASKEKMTAAIRGIGRINLIGHPRIPYGGTGFLVGPGLMLTNRHVAAIFTNGVGTAGLRMIFRSEVDLKEEVGSDLHVMLKVTGTALIHPYWDAAILKVEGMPPDVKPLQLAHDSAGFGKGRQVAIVGYPAFDPRNNAEVQRREFNNIFEKKRLQPGYLTGTRVVDSFGNRVEALTHDASTLGGNSGSAVVDVATGTVVALHFAGIYKDANFAVPAWELARDRKVTDLGVNFTTRSLPVPPPPRWLSAWSALQLDAPAATTQAPQLQTVPPAAANFREISVTIPIHVTVRVGDPVPAAAAPTVSAGGGTATVADDDPIRQLKEARRLIAEDTNNYYNAQKDASDAAAYYTGISTSQGPAALFRSLSELLRNTHTNQPRYKPTTHLYPLVDLHPDGELYSIYSEESIDAEALIRAEAAVESMRESMEAAAGSDVDLEAVPDNSAEHVVPQSWFAKREPMRGDLHHLFSCDRTCNSFRGNIPYFEFGEETVREDCGRREDLKFEPKGGKGQVARAVLYFLLRYPGEINNRANEYTPDRIALLLDWHSRFEVTLYERHRNREIFLKQGNRNPLIDHPEWADRIDFRRGLGSA